LSCEPSNKVKAGPPELVLFAPINADGSAADVTAPVPARSRIAAVFDRLLEPSKLVELGDAGLGSKVNVMTVATNIGTAPEIEVGYTPNGSKDSLVFAPGPNGPPFNTGSQPGPNIIALLTPTLPSGAQVTVTLNKENITSKAGESFVVAQADGSPVTAETLQFATEPLAVSFMPSVDADGGATCATVEASGDNAALTITFNNLVATDTATVPAKDDILKHISLKAMDASGAALPAESIAAAASTDAMGTGLASQVVLSPPSSPAGWPVGATLTVTVDATAQDVALGAALGAPSSACFVVTAPSDGGNQ
jgi:hypothetical protein